MDPLFLNSSSYLDFAESLAVKHDGPARPAWQYLPDQERAEYLKAGFRISDTNNPQKKEGQ